MDGAESMDPTTSKFEVNLDNLLITMYLLVLHVLEIRSEFE